MATVEIRELIKPETGEKFYPYAHLNGVKGAELLPRIGGSVQTTLPTPIFQVKDALNAQFYPQTHAEAVIGLAQMIESNQFFVKESDGNGGFRIKLKDEFAGFYANGWAAAGGVGTGGGGGGGGIDLDRVWQSLTNNTDKPNVKINIAHIPDITTAKITDLESWISAKGYALNSSLPTEQTVAGWGFTKNAGTVTSVILNSGDGIAVTNSGVPIISSGSRTISISSTYRTRINNGNTAYGWGNHADAGYLTSADLSGYATESWANNRFLLKAGGDISGDIFHEIEETEEGSGEIVIDELWRITENGDATFKSLSVDGVDFYTINSRVNTLWNARNNYVTISGAQTITGAKTFSGGIVMSDSDIVPSADSANRIGSSSARFGAGYIRNLYPTFLAFMSDNGQTQVGSIGMGSGYANITLNGTPSNSVYNFNAGYGFFHGGNGDVPCGRSDHRWEAFYGVNADLTGDIDLASTSHIDIGPARIEYDATSGAIHVTTNQTGNNAPSIGFYSDGFNAAGGIGDGGGGGYGVEQITTNEDGTIDFHFTGGSVTTIDINHEHPQYMKHVECASQSEYNAITTKDSGTIYTIGVGPSKVYIGTALIYQES